MSTAEDLFGQLVADLEDTAGVTPPDTAGARGFGSTALKVDGSIFAMLSRGALVVKLPRERVTEVIASGVGAPFTAGKTTPMKEWVVVTTDDAPTFRALAIEALAFGRRRTPPHILGRSASGLSARPLRSTGRGRPSQSR